MEENEKYRLNKKDFIPFYGLLKYIGRTMPDQIHKDLRFKDNVKIDFNDFCLTLYNICVVEALTIGAMATAVGLEKLLK